jgi:hypothetical protein
MHKAGAIEQNIGLARGGRGGGNGSIIQDIQGRGSDIGVRQIRQKRRVTVRGGDHGTLGRHGQGRGTTNPLACGRYKAAFARQSTRHATSPQDDDLSPKARSFAPWLSNLREAGWGVWRVAAVASSAAYLMGANEMKNTFHSAVIHARLDSCFRKYEILLTMMKLHVVQYRGIHQEIFLFIEFHVLF